MDQKKVFSKSDRTIIPATQAYENQLNHFLSQNIHIFRHLDWFEPIEWLGQQPFLIELSGEDIEAVLCATPENDEVAWVRAFGVKDQTGLDASWRKLLTAVKKKLRELSVTRLAALALHPWFEALLVEAGFVNQQNIVVLEWQGKLPPAAEPNKTFTIRPMQLDDLQQVDDIDSLAFPPMWQNTLPGLTKAFSQRGISTVAIRNDQVIGYQISTCTPICGHLARLAVHPDYQRQGIAFSLVFDLLKEFEQHGFWRVTVNTQSDNYPSLLLYEKLFFAPTSEEISVYEYHLE